MSSGSNLPFSSLLPTTANYLQVTPRTFDLHSILPFCAPATKFLSLSLPSPCFLYLSHLPPHPPEKHTMAASSSPSLTSTTIPASTRATPLSLSSPPLWCCVSLSPPPPPPPPEHYISCPSPSSHPKSSDPGDQQQQQQLQLKIPAHETEKRADAHKKNPHPDKEPSQRKELKSPEVAHLTPSSSPAHQQHHYRKAEKLKAEESRKSGDLLKSGEVSTLIKQGFIEKTHGISTFKRRLSPGRVSPLLDSAISDTMLPSYSAIGKFNSVLNVGLHSGIGASSPPAERIRTSPTLSDMLANEPELQSKLASSHNWLTKTTGTVEMSRSTRDMSSPILLAGRSGSLLNDAESSDVKLTLRGKDGRTVTINLHRRILAERSKFFAGKLSETWPKHQPNSLLPIEISDCDDLEIYQETLQLLYCRDLKCRIMKCTVPRVLGILKVSALLLFEVGIIACLEYLEAVPWAEEEEDKVRAVLGQLQLDSFAAADVLRRLHPENLGSSEEILGHLLQMVIKGKDEKARRQMKSLVSRMLRENILQNNNCIDLSKESLYYACSTCLDALLHIFMQASKTDFMNQGNEDRGTLVAQIARQADNLQWLLEILIDRHIADDFAKMWAHQSELVSLHKQIATMLRFEVSRLTARLCVAIGKGQVLCPVQIRYMLLQTWLPPLVDDFGWMQRCYKGLDKKVIEEGISQTILTLPLKQQQSILLAWFDRFSNNGDDCPNLQKAFEVWWRRTFVRPYFEDLTQLFSLG